LSYIISEQRAKQFNAEQNRTEYSASLICDDVASLPVNNSDHWYLLGSDAKVISNGKKYVINSSGTWVEQPSENAWENVYTKVEVDNILTEYYTAQQIDATFLDYYTIAQVDEKLTHKAALAFSPAGVLSSLVNCTFTIPDSTRTLRFTVGKLNATTNYLQIYVNGVDKGYITFDVSRNVDNWGE